MPMLTGNHETLGYVIVQWLVIILAARIFAWLARWVWQPGVVGEMLAGLILGPSCCGYFFPELWKVVFRAEAAPFFLILKEVGLILLMFLVGLECEFGHRKASGRSAVVIALAGLLIPFGLGLAVGPLVQHNLMHRQGDTWGVMLFMGTALCITALPILGRIMMELSISRTNVASTTITAAAINDVIGWILLASVAAVVRSQFEWLMTLRMAGFAIAFFLAMMVARPLLHRAYDRYFRKRNGVFDLPGMAMTMAMLLLCSWITHEIGIFAIIGAFLFGCVMSGHVQFRDALGPAIRSFVAVLFLPVYFTYTGLHTDITGLATGTAWLWCGLVCLLAIVGKWATCSLTARSVGFSWKESAFIGVMMNARGLMELIVINLGRDLGVINDQLYTMLALMAVLTTVMASPVLIAFCRGTELEPGISSSGFLGKNEPCISSANQASINK